MSIEEEKKAISVIDKVFGRVEIVGLVDFEPPPFYGGPIARCGWCQTGTHLWILVGERPVPMHRGCVESWEMEERGVDIVHPTAPVSRRDSAGHPEIPTQAKGVYAKWAARRVESD